MGKGRLILYHTIKGHQSDKMRILSARVPVPGQATISHNSCFHASKASVSYVFVYAHVGIGGDSLGSQLGP